MVLKPLPVLHLAFTMMGVMLPVIEKKAVSASANLPAVEVRYPVPLTV